MSINPFTKNLEELQREHNKSSIELLDWLTKLAWFQDFDLDRESINFKNAERKISDAQAKLRQAQQPIVELTASVKELELKAAMGFNPRHWFSSERAIAKRGLMEAQQRLAAQKSMVKSSELEISQAAQLCKKIQSEIVMARAFDPLLAQSAIVGLRANVDRLDPQIASLRKRSSDLDEIIREPLESLRKEKADRDMLMKRISRAEVFNSSLDNSINGTERAKIHEQCERVLGVRSPRNILQHDRGVLRGVDDRIRKLQDRVDSLIRFATWEIRHIIIDGNNLCYEGNRFLKLAALEALVPILARKYTVTLIFDASIRRKLGLNSKDIEARFPQAKQVHIVASKSSADETVLAEAGDDAHTFVLSNDRFVDYPEKMAVKERRVLRHEIVNQSVYIHELRVTARFDINQDAEAV